MSCLIYDRVMSFLCHKLKVKCYHYCFVTCVVCLVFVLCIYLESFVSVVRKNPFAFKSSMFVDLVWINF